jgi:Mrp family chromosome partitioning ATPase
MNAYEIIKNTGFENLEIIPSVPLPPNPSELISNGKLEILLAQLENSYDYIIMDTAPVNPVTDAYILSPISDVTIYIIRYDYTPKIFIQKLQESYSKGTIKNPAIVYNGIRGKGINKYGYGYGYGYGYTEDETNKGFWNRLFKVK